LRGNDLHTVVDVPVTVAALGGEVAAPTLDGANVSLTIPAETQNGRVLRLRGLGMPSVRGESRGDLLVQVSLTMPRSLTDRERELFRELASLRGDKVGAGPSTDAGADAGAATGAGENATRRR
jgi:DnaJ-class molecular chaperone